MKTLKQGCFFRFLVLMSEGSISLFNVATSSLAWKWHQSPLCTYKKNKNHALRRKKIFKSKIYNTIFEKHLQLKINICLVNICKSYQKGIIILILKHKNLKQINKCTTLCTKNVGRRWLRDLAFQIHADFSPCSSVEETLLSWATITNSPQVITLKNEQPEKTVTLIYVAKHVLKIHKENTHSHV